MNRREFFRLSAVASAGFALDTDRWLWVRGRKTIFLPSQMRIEPGMLVYQRHGLWYPVTPRGDWRQSPIGVWLGSGAQTDGWACVSVDT